MSIDTGDVVRFHGETYTVACQHDGYIYTMGYPSKNLRASDVELIEQATPEKRLETLRAMAAVQSRQHRPECARQRLNEMAASDDCLSYLSPLERAYYRLWKPLDGCC